MQLRWHYTLHCLPRRILADTRHPSGTWLRLEFKAFTDAKSTHGCILHRRLALVWVFSIAILLSRNLAEGCIVRLRYMSARLGLRTDQAALTPAFRRVRQHLILNTKPLHNSIASPIYSTLYTQFTLLTKFIATASCMVDLCELASILGLLSPPRLCCQRPKRESPVTM
jgi:hypothetical protein